LSKNEAIVNDIRNCKLSHDLSTISNVVYHKHLIFTGKNGSGKTSVLDALLHYLNTATSDRLYKTQQYLQMHKNSLEKLRQQRTENAAAIEEKKAIIRYTDELRLNNTINQM